MKERPILFTGPMVRSILFDMKGQTRRVFKAKNGGVYPNRNDLPGMQQILRSCPYGQPGDRLWVRETFARIDGQTRPWIETDYRATYTHGDRLGDSLGIKKRWTPAIHMPRHASRITLAVINVRVEPLQEISEADALAEGITKLAPPPAPHEWSGPNRFTLKGMGCGVSAGSVSWNAPTAVDLYRRLWEEINGAGSWAANPWVWVMDFERLKTTRETQL